MQRYTPLPSSSAKDGHVVAPTLLIGEPAWQKIMAYTDLCDTEINGFAYVRGQGLTFFIGNEADVFITRQTVSAAKANVDASDFAKALDAAVVAGRADELRLQWHSHVNGATYFSSTDMGTIEAYGDAGMQSFFSLVVNKQGDGRCRYDQYTPVRVGVEMPVLIYETVPEELHAACQADIADLVTVEVPKPVATRRRVRRRRTTSS